MSEEGLSSTVEIADVVKEYFGVYAKYVIGERAIPDIRDGLKPVHRRLIYAAWNMGARSPNKAVKCAKIVGECFVAGELVHTENGLEPIESLKIGDSLMRADGSLCKVVQCFKNDPQKLVRVNLESGTSIDVTPGQLFRVLNDDLSLEWVEAKNLEGKRVLLSNYRSLGDCFCGNGDFVDQAYLSGLFVAKSYLTDRDRGTRVGISMCDSEVIDFVQDRLFYFGEKPFRSERIIEGNLPIDCVRFSPSNKDNFLYKIASKYSHQQKVPSAILKDRNLYPAFIAGFIDGDGHIRNNNKKRDICLTSKSDILIRHLQSMLSDMGINSSIVVLDSGVKQIFITGKRASLLCSVVFDYLKCERKKRAAQALIDYSGLRGEWDYSFESIPVGEILKKIKEKHFGGGWFKDKKEKKFRMGIKHPSSCKIRYHSKLYDSCWTYDTVDNTNIINKLNKIGDRDFAQKIDNIMTLYCSNVVSSVVPINEQETYDVQIDSEDHEILVRGFVVHNCMGNFHPHGDKAIYDSLVRMTHRFAMRIPLFEGQGNFGSIDGDPPAAMRYTEARLFKVGQDLFCRNLNPEVVRFVPTYDDSTTEPEVLPSELPHLLLNYNTGIAVGLATEVLSCSAHEIIDCLLGEIKEGLVTKHEKSAPKKTFMGPDLPTCGVIEFDLDALNGLWNNGKSNWKIRGEAFFETDESTGSKRVVVSSLPFQQQKDKWLEETAKLIVQKNDEGKREIEGVTDMRDESNADGIRIVFDIHTSSSPDVVLNQLYKKTRLQKTLSTGIVATVDGKPKYVGVREILLKWLDFRRDCLKRILEKEKREKEERIEIVDGLLITHKNLNKVIKTIRDSEDAKQALIDEFKMTERQSAAVVAMRLGSLRKIDNETLVTERKELQERIDEIKDILSDPKKIDGLIGERLSWWRDQLDSRKTKVVNEFGEISALDTVIERDVVVSINRKQEFKVTSIDSYRKTKRGGKGVKETDGGNPDEVPCLLAQVTTHDMLYAFTNKSRVFEKSCHELPITKRTGKRKPIKDLFPDLQEDEYIVAIMAMNVMKMPEESSVIMIRSNGNIKRLQCKGLLKKRGRMWGDVCCRTDLDDSELVSVTFAEPDKDLIVFTENGLFRRFSIDVLKPMPSRNSGASRCMSLMGDDKVIGVDTLKDGNWVCSISENGYGVRLKESELNANKGRVGKGSKLANTDLKSGKIVFGGVLSKGDELFVTTSGGKSIRIASEDIREVGRGCRGVRVQKMSEDERIVAVVKIEVNN